MDDINPKEIVDAQLRKERLEAEMITKRSKKQGGGNYSVWLLHYSEPGTWIIWRGVNGRWYGRNDETDRVIDAPTLKCAKQDLRLGYFV